MADPVQVNGSYSTIIRVSGHQMASKSHLFDSSLLQDLEMMQSSQVGGGGQQEQKAPSGGPTTWPLPRQPRGGPQTAPPLYGGLRQGLPPTTGPVDHRGGGVPPALIILTGPQVTREEWQVRFEEMKAASSSYFVLVVEDVGDGRVVGAATLLVERKFIHRCGQVVLPLP